MPTVLQMNMARMGLRGIAYYHLLWDGQVPEDALGNKLQDVYKQEGAKLQLDWVDYAEPLNLESSPNLSQTSLW